MNIRRLATVFTALLMLHFSATALAKSTNWVSTVNASTKVNLLEEYVHLYVPRHNDVSSPVGFDMSIDKMNVILQPYSKDYQYECKICGKKMRQKLTMAGHIRGAHHKWVPSLHMRKIK